GSDTLRVVGATILTVRLNVAANVDQTIGDADTARNFENLDGSAASGALTITGSTGANTLIGGSSSDTIDGYGGYDVISGGGGGDRIFYRQDALSLDGGTGSDTLVPVSGWSLTIDLSAADQTTDDTVSVKGFENVDGSLMTGGLSVIGNSAANVLTGTLGLDYFVVGAGDTVYAGAAWDHVTVDENGSAAVYLHGGEDVDVLIVTKGYDFSTSTITGFEHLRLDPNATVTFTAEQWAQFTSLQFGDQGPVTTVNIRFTNPGTLDVKDDDNGQTLDPNDRYNITGSSGDDIIRGANIGTNTIHAGDGDDVIIVRAKHTIGVNDKVYGEAGNDRISMMIGGDDATAPIVDGGTGSDTLTSTRFSATIDLGETPGVNQISNNLHAIARNFENVDWTGNSLSLYAYGNSGDNTLIGGSHHDTIEGRGGNDTIDGGAGNDTITIERVAGDSTITGGAGNDIFRFARPDFVSGLTTITDFSHDDDKFSFRFEDYLANRSTFTTIVTDETSLAGAVDISQTDVLRIDGGGVTKSAIQSYLNANATAANGEGLFIIG
ncbi:calcium-binding protein, partial [Rhizobiaceae sp. 2RAB30]